MDDRNTRRQPPGAGTGEPVGDTTQGQGLGSLVTGIVEDLQNIVRGEVQLAKTELKEDASTVGKAAGMLVAGVMLGWAGFLFLMAAVTFLLDDLIEEMWVSTGIVALTLLAIAAVVAMMGKSKLSKANLKPEDTIETLKEDKEWASRQIKSVKK